MQIFDEIEDDQYDFHGYNMRKSTINIYLKFVYRNNCLFVFDSRFHTRLLKWEDQLRSHPAYLQTALQGSRVR
jgi:peptide alpha-N-acetyltransferase